MTAMDLTTTPPHSLEAEQVVIGSMLAAPPLIADVSNVVKPEDFYEPRHAIITETLRWLSDEGMPVEAAALIARLRDQGELNKVGGPEYIARLYRQSSPHNCLYYANIVAEKSAKRQIMNLYVKGLKDAQDGSGVDLRQLVSETTTGLDAITETRVTNDVERAGHTIDATLDHMEVLGQNQGGVTGVPTGFYELDRLTYGYHPGQMIVIAARPGVGKSTLGLDALRACSIKHGMPSLLFSLEMSTDEINMRMLSAEAGVELNRIRSGRLEPQHWDRIQNKMQAIRDAPLFYDDTPGNTMSQIRQKARRIKQRHGLSLIVIDYLQLMTGEGRAESRQQEVSGISRQIKLLAKELEVPIIAMSQLNRGSESRADKKPQVADLRESGAIEQDSDVIMLIHREDMYDQDSTRVGEADVIIGKQRSAPQGTAVLAFQGAYSRFVDMAAA